MTAPTTRAPSHPAAPQRPLRVLALVPKPEGVSPGQRYRLEQWAPHLEADHGVAVDFAPFESPALTEVLYRPGHRLRKARLVLADTARRWRERRRALDYDAVAVYREATLAGGAWLERWLARRGVPMILDFDDAIWNWDRGVNGILSLARMPWKTAHLCRLAAAVTVGNDYLADFARRHNPQVAVVPTTIDIDRYPAFPPPPPAPFTVVWTGSHSTLAHLDTIRPALEALGQRMPLRLRVVCDRPPAPFEHVALDFVPWRAATEAADLAPGHVGVMPVPDSAFTRGKCGCKALQYMAIGRPAVVSPVGVNGEIVRDGVNGLWATTTDQWVAQLGRLADAPALRQRLGAAGRETVLGGFTAARAAERYAGVVRAVARRATVNGGP